MMEQHTKAEHREERLRWLMAAHHAVATVEPFTGAALLRDLERQIGALAATQFSERLR